MESGRSLVCEINPSRILQIARTKIIWSCSIIETDPTKYNQGIIGTLEIEPRSSSTRYPSKRQIY